MNNEQNQSVDGLQVSTVITVSTNQRTGEDGAKKGHSWYAKNEIGLLISKGPNGVEIKKPDGEVEEYKFDNEEYFYTFAEASEVEYESRIKEAITKAWRKVSEYQEEAQKLQVWLSDFQDSVSFIGKLKAFVRGLQTK